MKNIISFFQSPLTFQAYIAIILCLLCGFFLLHTLIWFTFTKKLLDTSETYYVGDLGRLSYQTSSIHYRKLHEVILASQHTESKDWDDEPFDIVTIGDSFSNAGSGGTNPYYQDYITDLYQKKVLNIAPSPFDTNYIEMVITLLHNKVLDKISPKLIILESIERNAIDRLSTNIKWDANYSSEQTLNNFQRPIQHKNIQKDISFINNGNYKFILNTLMYSFNSKPIKRSNVYKVLLNKHLFSVENSNTLLFYEDDINHIPKSTYENIKRLNNNLNHLAAILKDKNITLVFMPAIDKYNLYAPFIKNNPFNKSRFFELLRPLNKDYHLVDTKKILSSLLPSQKDLYYADDTHWSYIASKAIVEQMPINKFLEKKRGSK